MRPRIDEVLQSIIWTYDEHILPAVEGELPKSLALTVSNLLRHVALRLEHEEPALVEDNAELRALMGAIANYIAGLPEAPAALAALLGDVRQAAKPCPMEGYSGLPSLTDVAQGLRKVLDEALTALQAQRGTLGADPAYQALRQAIRDYLNHQLARQSTWIQAAFTLDRR